MMSKRWYKIPSSTPIEDLMQLENAAKFKSWLAEIARNCAREWVRKQRGEVVSLDEVDEGVLQTQDSPDEQLIRLEQRELIRRTMEPRFRRKTGTLRVHSTLTAQATMN